ncbi:NmrA domain-containing protein [Mycena chlorophos]|uniref:NmrA domain-containing protein n=1 Tax=Mycena chlorophos TaxID=658473 RepID=A0A8H6TQ35_MYCCL|nr:NmrA domain-containing protein [Mycena chlorophos]
MADTNADKTILLLGATGYVGGTVLTKLLAMKVHPRIVTLVRDAEKAEKLKSFGAEPVVGPMSDTALLQRLASEVDVIFSVANSDDMPAAKALLAGAKIRFEKTGKKTKFIHTSGGAVIADLTSMGTNSNSPIWDDLNLEQLATIRPEALHRDVDLEVIGADTAGYTNSYIVVPSLVWGLARTPLVDAGVQRSIKGILPFFIPSAIARGQGGFVGEGKNVVSTVEVHELADLFILLYDTISDPATVARAGHGHEGIYFGENGAVAIRQLAEFISRALVAEGRGKSAEATRFTEQELKDMFPVPFYATVLGANAKVAARRARETLGWNPKLAIEELSVSVGELTKRYLKAA